MSKQANPVMIGGFVLGALALLVIAILVFSSGALFQEKQLLVSYFPGTVKGLSVGARVEFQGVQVGQVNDIALEYNTDDERFDIPVYYEIWSDKTRIVGNDVGDHAAAIRMLVDDKGLRAKLESVSIVTGQYMVALDMQPDTPIRRIGAEKGVIEIPTVTADRDRLVKALEHINLNGLVSSATAALDAIKALADNQEIPEMVAHAKKALIEAQQLIARIDAGVDPLLERIDTTLVDYSALAGTAKNRVASLSDSLEASSTQISRLAGDLDRQVGGLSKSAKGAFDQAGQAFGSVDDLVSADSGARYDLELLLKEAAGAARSLRILADYLQQNPDALLKGK